MSAPPDSRNGCLPQESNRLDVMASTPDSLKVARTALKSREAHRDQLRHERAAAMFAGDWGRAASIARALDELYVGGSGLRLEQDVDLRRLRRGAA